MHFIFFSNGCIFITFHFQKYVLNFYEICKILGTIILIINAMKCLLFHDYNYAEERKDKFFVISSAAVQQAYQPMHLSFCWNLYKRSCSCFPSNEVGNFGMQWCCICQKFEIPHLDCFDKYISIFIFVSDVWQRMWENLLGVFAKLRMWRNLFNYLIKNRTFYSCYILCLEIKVAIVTLLLFTIYVVRRYKIKLHQVLAILCIVSV